MIVIFKNVALSAFLTIGIYAKVLLTLRNIRGLNYREETIRHLMFIFDLVNEFRPYILSGFSKNQSERSAE